MEQEIKKKPVPADTQKAVPTSKKKETESCKEEKNTTKN